MSHRPTRLERRRARLALRIVSLEAMESRNLITESLGILTAGIGVPVALVGRAAGDDAAAIVQPTRRPSSVLDGNAMTWPALPPSATTGGSSRGTGPDESVATGSPTPVAATPTFAAAIPKANVITVKLPVAPASSSNGGGAGGSSHGGSGSVAPAPTSAPAASQPLPPTPTSPLYLSTLSGSGATTTSSGATIVRDAAAQKLNASPEATATSSPASSNLVSQTSTPSPTPTPTPSPTPTSTAFSISALNYIQGNALVPSGYQVATLGGNVDLRAQAQGASGVTYSWNTSGLTDATNIVTSGSGNFDLSFQWIGSNSTATTNSVVLTATNSSNQQLSQTYYFAVPAGSGTSNTGAANWSSTLSPDTVSLGSSTWGSGGGVRVDANSGSLQTNISLPSYNPSVPALSLTYDSLAANPQPIIVAKNPLSGSSAVPSQVAATLTFDGSTGTTSYYNTSQLTPGDIQQVALQANASGLSTGRYNYSVQLVNNYSSPTTTTLSGTATVVNEANSAIGAGWTLTGLEQIVPAPGGVIVTPGSGNTSLWFAGNPGSGGTYTTPAGDFSTLTLNGNGTYTRTLINGSQIVFNSAGDETAMINPDGVTNTYSYNGSSQLQTVTDSYGNQTTFSYSGGELSSIQDPAGRVTTFTHSGTNLVGVQQADSSKTTLSYNTAGQITQISDSLGNVTTVAYDNASRVATVTLPELSTETFGAFQEQGWTNTGTSSNPAAPTLVATAAATLTDPNGNSSKMLPDWYGLGQTSQAIDALGNVTTNNINSSGMPSATIDPLNRITQNQFDSHGDITQQINPDGTTEKDTYNGFSEVLTSTNEAGLTTTYTYDSRGDFTGSQDPTGATTSQTFTSKGQVATSTDSNNNTTTYMYDSQGRLTTTVFADGSTNLKSYDTQGDVIKATDGEGLVTTYAFDSMDRMTGTTDAAGGHTTIQYDGDGNEVAMTNPLGQVTKFAYDSMNRLATTTDALGYQTLSAYDGDGNRTSTTDATGKVTTYAYNQINQQISVVEPISNGTGMGSYGKTSTSYDADGEQLSTTTSLGTTTKVYNSRGWLTSTTDPLGNTTTYTYSPTGHVLSETTPAASGGVGYKVNPISSTTDGVDGSTPTGGGSGGTPTGGGGGGGGQTQSSNYTYDSDGRLLTSTDPLGNATTYTYDKLGNQISVEDANGNATSYAYDSENRLTTITNALGETTVYGYDSDDNKISVTNGLGQTTTMRYDSLGRETGITTPTGAVTTITYNAAGRETSLTDPDGNTTQWAYDSNGRMTTLTEPNGAVATFVYNQDNQVVDTTDVDGRRTTFAYDGAGDRTGESWLNSSGQSIYSATFTYNDQGEMTGASDPYANLTFTYDNDGRLSTDATSGPGGGQPSVTLSYAYDGLGDKTSVTDNLSSQGVISYSYDLDQRVTTLTTSYGGTAGPQVVVGYNPTGLLSSQTRTVGSSGTLATTFAYDAGNRETTASDGFTPSGGGSSTPVASYSFGYDKADQLTSQVNADGSDSYAYDNSGELTGVTYDGSTTNYSYDANGNPDGPGTTTATGNETTSTPGFTYTYDNAGNMVSQTNTATNTTTTFSYDYLNRLTQVTTGGKVTATYTYNALNQRIGINDNGSQIWTVYDGKSGTSNPYADFNGSGNILDRYVFGPTMVNNAVTTGILARTSGSGATAWYLTDNVGSVRDVVGLSGSAATVLDHVVYDAHGSITSESSPGNGDRFKYAGMEYDPATGQYYDRARYYDEAIGRFMEQDPIGFNGGTTDLYEYVNNDPLDQTDPTGLIPPQAVLNAEANAYNIGGAARYNVAVYGWSLVNRDMNNVLSFSQAEERVHSDRTTLERLLNFVDILDDILNFGDAKEFYHNTIDGGLDEAVGDVLSSPFVVIEPTVQLIDKLGDSAVAYDTQRILYYSREAMDWHANMIGDLYNFDVICSVSFTINTLRGFMGFKPIKGGNIN